MGSMENIFAVNIDKNNKINKRKDVNECLSGERGNWCATSLKENGTYETYAYCPETEEQRRISEISKKSKKKSNSSEKKTIKKKSSLSSVSSYEGEEPILKDYWKNLIVRKDYNWQQTYTYNMLPKSKRDEIDKLSLEKQLLFLEKTAKKNSKYRPPYKPPSPDNPPPMYKYKIQGHSDSSNSVSDSDSVIVINRKKKQYEELKESSIKTKIHQGMQEYIPVWITGAPNTMLYKGKHIGNNCSGYIINIREAKEINKQYNPSRFDKYHEDYR